MLDFTLSPLRNSLRVTFALLASSAVFTAGCANMATTASSMVGNTNAGTITGKIHGGNQPVAFATVELWFAGQGTTLASKQATTTSADDGAGSFNFIQGGSGPDHFTCPGGGDPLVYVLAKSGNTLNTHDSNVLNDASVFLAAYGPCSTIGSGSYVNMTELTTVATMAAWQQYFNPSKTTTSTATAESFATDGSGLSYLAMKNAFSVIPNMVEPSTGTIVTSKSIPAGSITAGYGYGGTSVTATPESAKINTLGNILASCINNASGTATNCVTLFTNATGPDPSTTSQPSTSFPTATDTLQAIYYMLTNPTNSGNLGALYALQPASGAPFQTALGSAPTDWTIAISYSSSSTCNSGSGHLITSASDLAVDSTGAIWIANSEVGGNLSQLSPSGVPITCVSPGGNGPYTGITIDSTPSLGNVWVADAGGTNVYRYTPGPASSSALAFSTVTFPVNSSPCPSGSIPTAIAADGSGNIFYTSSTTNSLCELIGANASSPVTPKLLETGIGTGSRVFLDSLSGIWTTSGSTYVTRSNYTANSGTQVTTSGPSYGIAVTGVTTGTNYVYVDSDGSTNDLAKYSGNASTAYTLAGSWPVTGLNTPYAVASDGAKNVWAVNNATSSVVEVGFSAQTLSPAGGFQKNSTFLGSGRAIVIDQSGNVWIGRDGSNSITEIVGAAVPVYQPYSRALATGNFQTAP